MKSIILLGYMCAGKTTVGRQLAKEMGLTFYDLDWYVEHRYHRRVHEIFAEQGEEKFRDLERRMLHEVAEFQDIVLSLGGGTPCFFDNMDYINRTGLTCYLKASPQTILQHLSISRGHRPLLQGKSPEELTAYVTEQIARREHFYLQARHTIDINVLDSFEKISLVTAMIRQHIQQDLTQDPATSEKVEN